MGSEQQPTPAIAPESKLPQNVEQTAQSVEPEYLSPDEAKQRFPEDYTISPKAQIEIKKINDKITRHQKSLDLGTIDEDIETGKRFEEKRDPDGLARKTINDFEVKNKALENEYQRRLQQSETDKQEWASSRLEELKKKYPNGYRRFKAEALKYNAEHPEFSEQAKQRDLIYYDSSNGGLIRTFPLSALTRREGVKEDQELMDMINTVKDIDRVAKGLDFTPNTDDLQVKSDELRKEYDNALAWHPEWEFIEKGIRAEKRKAQFIAEIEEGKKQIQQIQSEADSAWYAQNKEKFRINKQDEFSEFEVK